MDTFAEPGDGGVLVRSAHAAVKAGEGDAVGGQDLRQPVERGAIMRKDKLLLARVAPEEIQKRDFLAGNIDLSPLAGDRLPLWRPAMTLGKAKKRALHRAGRGARRAQKMAKRRPLATALCSDATNGVGEIPIGGLFGVAGIHAQGRRVAPRQLKSDHGAGVADHHGAHQLAQTIGARGLSRISARHVGSAELLQRLEDAGLEQREQIVELDHAVLHGCGR